MTTTRFLLGLAIVVMPLLAGCSDTNVVAEVGGARITRADLELYAQSRARTLPDSRALDALIERELLAEGAKTRGLADDPQVRARLAAARREVMAQVLLERALQGSSDDELKARYEAHKDALAKRAVHVQHIAVRLDPAADAAARLAVQTKVNALYARLLAGESFDVVAKEASEDTVTAERGGDLGELLEGQVDASFFDQAVALKKGELSKPFQSPFGMHLVRAVEDSRTVVPPFEEVKGRLAADDRRERETRLLEELRARVTVKRHPERLQQATGAADGGGSGT